jgi:hypothetical protein
MNRPAFQAGAFNYPRQDGARHLPTTDETEIKHTTDNKQLLCSVVAVIEDDCD